MDFTISKEEQKKLINSSEIQKAKDLVNKNRQEFLAYSRSMWGYFGYSSIAIITPWHDDPDLNSIFSFKISKKFLDLFNLFVELKIDLETYSIISLSIAKPEQYSSIFNLFCNTSSRSWVKKLVNYANDNSIINEVAKFILHYIHLQIEYKGVAKIPQSIVVRKDKGSGYHLETYCKLVDRIHFLRDNEIDMLDWLDEKVKIFVGFFPDAEININTIVNVNGVDPDIEEFKKRSKDSWKEIRSFLGLSSECVFVDGAIPKGWLPSSEDSDDLKKIVKINGDGFYFYSNGAQRRGKFHYMKNKYFMIKCDPSNFQEFKKDWRDIRLISGMPTWEEYLKSGKFPGLWDSEGNHTSKGKSIKWRKERKSL